MESLEGKLEQVLDQLLCAQSTPLSRQHPSNKSDLPHQAGPYRSTIHIADASADAGGARRSRSLEEFRSKEL